MRKVSKSPKNPWAVKMAKLRAAKLGPEKCSESARKAGLASGAAAKERAAARRAAREAQAAENAEATA